MMAGIIIEKITNAYLLAIISEDGKRQDYAYKTPTEVLGVITKLLKVKSGSDTDF